MHQDFNLIHFHYDDIAECQNKSAQVKAGKVNLARVANGPFDAASEFTSIHKQSNTLNVVQKKKKKRLPQVVSPKSLWPDNLARNNTPSCRQEAVTSATSCAFHLPFGSPARQCWNIWHLNKQHVSGEESLNSLWIPSSSTRGAGSSELRVSSFISSHPSMSLDKLLFVLYSRTNFSRCRLHACSLSHSILIAAPRIYTRLCKSACGCWIYGCVLRWLG